MVDVAPHLPIDADVAPALADAATRTELGAMVSAILRARVASDPRMALMQAIGELKVTAHRNGLTEVVLDEELRYFATEERQGGIR